MQLYGVNGDREKFRKLTSHPQQTIGCELFEALDGDMRAHLLVSALKLNRWDVES
jgi:hypothetical protein